MGIYVLFGCIIHEGKEVLGVYNDRNKAHEDMDEMEKCNNASWPKVGYDYITLETYPLNKLKVT